MGLKNGRIYKPINMYRPEQVANCTIRDIKRALKANDATFDTCSNFFLSRAKKLISLYANRLPFLGRDEVESECVLDFISVFLKILFFFYATSPRVRQTYVVSEILLIVKNYILNAPDRIREQVTATIAREVVDTALFFSQQDQEDNIEILNLIIVLRSFDCHHVLDHCQLEEIFGLTVSDGKLTMKPKNFGYFQITTCIYYMQDDRQYDSLREAVIDYVEKLYGDDPGWQKKSDNVMLFLDIMRCPFVNDDAKQRLAKICLKHQGDNNLNARATALREYSQKFDWFFEWRGDVDLSAILMRKELRSPY